LSDPLIDATVFLAEILESSVKNIDSVKLSADGSFSFTVEAELPKLYVLRTGYDNYFMFAAEPGENINIEAGYSTLSEPKKVTGSEGTSKMVEYSKALKGTISKLQGLTEVYNQNADNENISEVVSTLDSTAQVYVKELNTYTKKYIDQNIGSLISLVALYQRVSMQAPVLDPEEDIEYFVKVDSSLFSRYPESEPVKALHMQVQELVSTVNSKQGNSASSKPGNPAPEISLPSPDGKIITLSSTRGKIVLLDFWAAWCPPCRRESPHLVAAYNKYKSKGFEIFQVSLDKTREDWLKGIQEDNLGQWIHVSDLKYWDSELVKLYKIESIPFNLLLDREGNVIASNLRGPKLEEKLEEVLSR
jgi:thiol-disulfide isomerase/thioredoxin